MLVFVRCMGSLHEQLFGFRHSRIASTPLLTANNHDTLLSPPLKQRLMSGNPARGKDVTAASSDNAEETNSTIAVLDNTTIGTVLRDKLSSYTGSKLVNLSKLGITKIETLSCVDRANRIDLSHNQLKSVRVAFPIAISPIGPGGAEGVDVFESEQQHAVGKGYSWHSVAGQARVVESG